METLNIMTAIKFWLFFMGANKRSKMRYYFSVRSTKIGSKSGIRTGFEGKMLTIFRRHNTQTYDTFSKIKLTVVFDQGLYLKS